MVEPPTTPAAPEAFHRDEPRLSVWLCGQQPAFLQRSGRYVAGSTAHPARMLPAVAQQAAERRFGPLGPLTADDIAGLVGLSFLGGEAVVLLGHEGWGQRVRSWLRGVGRLLRQLERA